MLKDIPKKELDAHFDKFEGCVPHLYLDTEGNPTLWKGHLVPMPFDPKAYGTWLMPDMSIATPQQVIGDMERVLADASWQKSQGFAKDHSAQFYGPLCSTRLCKSDGDRLFMADLYETETQLMRRIPRYPEVPWRWQFALIDLGFNLGVNRFVSGFPSLMMGISEHNPIKCGIECMRDEGKPPNPLVVERNDWTRSMFLEVAE